MMKFQTAKPALGLPSEREAGEITGRGTSSCLAGRVASLFLICLLAAYFGPEAPGAEKNSNQVELLIARNQVDDPYFHHSVVLMLPETEMQLVVGLIINKPTRLALSKLFPDSPEFKERTEPAYLGGPVDVRTPSIVFRSQTAPDNAVRLFGNVYLTFDSDLITKAFQNQKSGSSARLFLGRAQWSPGQLQNEMRMGGWYTIKAEGDLVFSPKPDGLWPTLHARAAPNKYIRYQLPSGNFGRSARKSDVM